MIESKHDVMPGELESGGLSMRIVERGGTNLSYEQRPTVEWAALPKQEVGPQPVSHETESVDAGVAVAPDDASTRR